MKNKITLTIILTSLFVLLTGALTAHAACTGHLDGVSGDTISGWAWDPEDPQKEVSVTLTIKNAADSAVVRSLTVNACESFSHLADAGIGTGNYGFSANAALSALPDGVYLAEASGNGDRLPNALMLEKSGASVKTISASGVRSLGASPPPPTAPATPALRAGVAAPPPEPLPPRATPSQWIPG